MRSTAKFSNLCVALAIGLTSMWSSQADARAQVQSEVRPAFTGALIYLGRSHGYGIGLSIPDSKIAVLYAYRIGDAEAVEGGDQPPVFLQTAYAVRVKGNPLRRGLVRAVFPSLGRVSLHFKPSGKRRSHLQRGRCHGKPQVTEYGTFRGKVALKGEGGYFEITTRSVGGALTQVPRSVCDGEADRDEDIDPRWDYVAPRFGFNFSPGRGSIALLYAAERTARRTIGIRVAHGAGASAGAEVDVRVLELSHGMAIGRSVFGNQEAPGTFTTSMPGEHPASATLKPPAPFQGEGVYLESSPTTHSWTGDLTVSLPGSDVSLTGPRFKTSLCVVSPLKAPDGCDFLRPKLVGNARLGLPVPGGIGE
ncbi:MAG TPA: hypothetical protein VFN18_08705 [Solirubrobacterales bacterium]|nr:hypothetical protein [Solirubrobacterales bacterium]